MMVEESSEPQGGYLRLLRRIASHWRLSLLICGGVAAPVAVWALLFLPKSYEAVATIFIEDPRRGPVSVLREWIPAGDASFQNAILRSRTLAEAVGHGGDGEDAAQTFIKSRLGHDSVLLRVVS